MHGLSRTWIVLILIHDDVVHLGEEGHRVVDVVGAPHHEASQLGSSKCCVQHLRK